MSYDDLTSYWSYKKLIPWQKFQQVADNDVVLYMRRGLLYYEPFESYIQMIDHGADTDWNGDGTDEFATTDLNGANEKFGLYAADFTSTQLLLVSNKNRDNYNQGSVSFWAKGLAVSTTLWQTFWGAKLEVTGDGYLKFSITDTFGEEFSVVGETDRSAGESYVHIVLKWRAKGDGSDYLELWVNNELENDKVLMKTITVPPMSDSNMVVGGGIVTPTSWTAESDMDELPTSGDWLFSTGLTDVIETTVASVSNGFVGINTTGYVDSAVATGYYYSEPNVDFNTGFMFEMMMRLDVSLPGSAADATGFQVIIADGSQDERVTLNILSNQIIITGSSTVVLYHDAFSTYSHYRLTVAATTWTLYINGKIRASGAVQSTSSDDVIQWGAGGSNSYIQCYVDYVRYYMGTITAMLGNSCGGYLDDFVMWNRKISVGEQTLLYNGGTGYSLQEAIYLSNGEIERLNWQPERYHQKILTSSLNITSSSQADISSAITTFFTQGSYPLHVTVSMDAKVSGGNATFRIQIDNLVNTAPVQFNGTADTLYNTVCFQTLAYGNIGGIEIAPQAAISGGATLTVNNVILTIREVR